MQSSAPMTAMLLALVLRWALELVLELVLLRWALVLLLALELVLLLLSENEQARCAPLPKFAVPMSGSQALRRRFGVSTEVRDVPRTSSCARNHGRMGSPDRPPRLKNLMEPLKPSL